MILRPYKFQILPVCQQLDDNQKVVGEQAVTNQGQPITVYGLDALKAWADTFEQQLAELEP